MNKHKDKLFQFITLMLLIISVASDALGQANFAVIPVMVEGDITEEAAKVIFRKTEQILTRNSAGAAGAADVFAVQAKLTVTNEAHSSGLVREVTSISGELQLVALNKVDNAKYYSVTVPVQAALKGSKEGGAILALANAIKPMDAVYTRFVRVAREKIEEYYSEHCSEVIGQATSLGLSGQYQAAMIYLTGMPASAPCHEEALELIAGLKAKIDADKEKEEQKKEEAKERAKEKAKDKNKDKDSDASDDDSDDDAADDSSNSDLDIYIESPNWEFKLIDATYLATSRKVKIACSITYTGKKALDGDCALGFRKAIDQEGDSFDTCYVYGDKYRTFPEDVPVKIEFYIDDVKKNPGKLSFVGLSVNYKKIELRNLTINE